LADISLQKQRKHPGAAEGDPFAKGPSGMLPAPSRRFHEPGYMGCRPLPLPNSVKPIADIRLAAQRSS
jgi:hypothetical protein